MLQYEYAHIWYVFAFVNKKRYFYVCEVCQRGVELDKKEIEAKLEKIPIPSMHRFGCLVLIAIIALIILFERIFD
ncbi:MAG: hypothetical protein R3B84_22270 [Zavarzinella sp.]